MNSREQIQKELTKIQTSNIRDADHFLTWLSALSGAYSSPEKEELIQELISKKLTPDIAWEIIQDEKNKYVDRFKSFIKDNNLILKLYSLGTKGKNYPAAYSAAIQALIYLYQENNTKEITLKVIYDLLHIPEFRDAFKCDNQFAPFFMEGFYSELRNYITSQCQDEKLKEILLDSCEEHQLDPKLVDAELKKRLNYSEPLKPEEEDIIAIQKFLGNVTAGSEVTKQLQLLEEGLEKAAGTRYNPDNKLLAGYIEGKPFPHKKLISDFLRDFAEQNGFSGYGRLKGFLMPDVFFSFLAKGGLFKDSVLQGDFHGDYTHFFQLYLITMWNKEDPNKPKLNCHPSDLLKWIGSNNKFSEWQQTFEASILSLYVPSTHDFRSVNGLHNYLNSPDCPFPVLHQLNKGRSAKGKKPFSQEAPDFEEFKPRPKNS